MISLKKQRPKNEALGPLDCHKCAHYYVTWDERFPHGCRAMGFKSWRYPCDEVRSAMHGNECLLFERQTKRCMRR